MSADTTTSFDISPVFDGRIVVPRIDLEATAAAQGVKPLDDPDTLRGDFWPGDESLDAFLAFVEASRREESVPGLTIIAAS